ncbi:MAG: hypothetical protein JWL90_4432 [Chthoniobacteraceae bacterium]|nr:hypothetical protein [Chthoniobacteraceae bacterium]
MISTLVAFKDIPGVFGSFIFWPDGTLAARDMPAIYNDDIFAEIGRRLNGIADAVDPQVPSMSEMLVKFDSYWLLSRRTPHYTLNVLAEETVNYPALKMASNVAMRHLGDKVVSAISTISTQVKLADLSPVFSPAPPAVETRPRRTWRGQVVD